MATKQRGRKMQPGNNSNVVKGKFFRADDNAQPAHSRAPEPLPFERDSYTSTAVSEIADRSISAALARFTGGLSPSALTLAYMDWAIHLSTSPGKRYQLVEKFLKKYMRFLNHLAHCVTSGEAHELCIEPLPQDKRFTSPGWQQLPFQIISQCFLLQQQWWHNATTDIPGVSTQHEKEVSFAARQILDMFSPSNFILTNPEVLERTIQEAGMNLLKGFQNFQEDWQRAYSGRRPVGADAFVPGKNVAATPGKVIYENELIELIQYDPSTDEVCKEPVLIIPAWIMKYYILDLSPNNSLVKYLRDQGFTVFMISWKNPTSDDRLMGMEDYLKLGPLSSIDVISSIVPDVGIHGTGYCLGGTLLSIAASTMARDGDQRLKSVTLLASETDFTEPGELGLFIDESQLWFLQNMMWEQGFLDTKQMSGAFQLLRSNDLIWSRIIHDYLMGERASMTDLMAWNADATRLPYKMHTEYLTQLFLNNDLSEGRYKVDGKVVSLTDIDAPIFAVGTEWDHVVPWRSAYKIHQIVDTDVTFLLTSGGHNAGIVSEPGHPDRRFHVKTKHEGDIFLDPDAWLERATFKEGSWWPEWIEWLKSHSSAVMPAPAPGNDEFPPLRDAPGVNVFAP